LAKVILTHDVDRVYKTYQYFTYTLKSIKKRDYKHALYHFSSMFYKDPYWNFDKITDIENQYGVKSVFFFLNESMSVDIFDSSNWKLSLGRYRIYDVRIFDIIRFLDRNGWEIGVHGSYNSFNNSELLLKEKIDMEHIVEHEIFGVRQHYLNIDENTWRIQNECGFKYDLSFGYKNSIGFKDNIFKPFHPLKNNFKVYPLTIMDIYFMADNTKWSRLNQILDQVEKHEAIFIINWHQRVFNDNEFPGYIEAYKNIIKECKNRDYEFILPKNVLLQL